MKENEPMRDPLEKPSDGLKSILGKLKEHLQLAGIHRLLAETASGSAVAGELQQVCELVTFVHERPGPELAAGTAEFPVVFWDLAAIERSGLADRFTSLRSLVMPGGRLWMLDTAEGCPTADLTTLCFDSGALSLHVEEPKSSVEHPDHCLVIATFPKKSHWWLR